ncbi:MAG: amino acid ABC transporter substrate-binding protein [Clostridiales bacterium]|nr:amino acid ABC transporter substrate-binding protein [Clostridiales bacterium]
MKRFLSLVIAGVMVLSMAGCGGSDSSTDTADEASAEEAEEVDAEEEAEEGEAEAIDKIVVGLDDTFAPMGFRDENNELVGFDIDLANAVGEVIGCEIEFQPIDWDTKETELETGKIDLIWNGFSYSEERAESMTLSSPYLDNAQIIIVPADSDIQAKADLAGKTVGLQDGSTAADAVEADDMYSEIGEIFTYDTNDLAFTDLSIGRVDAVVADEILAMYYIETSGADFRVLEDDFGSEVYVVAAKLGNAALMDQVEAALTEIGENGTAAEISEEWFGENIYIH